VAVVTLDAAQLAAYRRTGHLTVANVFAPAEMDAAIADAQAWGEEFLGGLGEAERKWYLDAGVARQVLRKLDNPAYHRPAFRRLAKDPKLVSLVEAIIGPGVTVYFSQIFFKPPEGGGPKPVHQDNYYFGPKDRDEMVTAWVALDDATVENGCLFFGEGTNLGPVVPHASPPGEPFNLLIPDDVAAPQAMTPAPVSKGGVSFHHGNTYHQSGRNLSPRWRRAVAFHYGNHAIRFVTPALRYDDSVFVTAS
jgi:ectoine hydroxylase-related dioxygenase (phytanoyl-CoA dioxygenase family)